MAIRKIIAERPIINVVDVIGDLVDSIRETNTISSSVEAATVYTITSENSLTLNEYIKIDDVVYIVSAPTAVSFNITGVTGIDFTGKTWKSQWPYYDHGHIIEIAGTLTTKSNGPDKMKKYPLVCLIEDFESTSIPGVAPVQSTLNMLIVTRTDKNYKASKRYEFSFDPVLIPIYLNLIKAFVSSGAILTQYGIIPHTPINRVYSGKQGPYGVIGHIFNDPLDAIEIKDIEVKFYRTNC